MSKNLLSMVFVICCFNSAFAFNADSLVTAGNTAYVNGDFQMAAEKWQIVIDSGYAAAELYFNLGNSYYRMNNFAKAIINYERALLIDPSNKDINFNLDLANAHVVDKIDVIPEFFLKKWIENAARLTSTNNWAIYSITTFVLFLIFLSIYLFSSKIFSKKIAFYLSIILLIISITTFTFSSMRKKMIVERNTAIIMSPSVTVKSSPNEYGTNLFILHEGTKVETVDSVGTWNEIKISNGNKGWIHKSALERI